jgi:hypothetical protein
VSCLPKSVLTHFLHKSVISSQLPWMLKMMNTSGSFSENSRLHLSFFHHKVLPLARHYDTLSGEDPAKFLFYKGRVPADFASAFPMLAPVLVRAMNDERYPELVVSQTMCSEASENALGNTLIATILSFSFRSL